jgi:hypothetical protein
VNLYRMSVDELRTASGELRELFEENLADRPEAAKVIVDAMELLSKELLVRTFRGDRELADKFHAKLQGEREN